MGALSEAPTQTQLATPSGSSLVGFLQAGVGTVADTVQAELRRIVYIQQFGGVEDGATDNAAAIALAKIYCDLVGAELVFPHTANSYKITANVLLPNKVRFEGSAISGAFQCQYINQKNGWIKGIDCHQLSISGAWNTWIENPVCDILYLDGFSSSWGSYWNQYLNIYVKTSLTLDMTNGPVNFNQFIGGRSAATTLIGDHSKYAGTLTGMFSNSFSIDFSPGGIIQSDADNSTQYLYNCWSENSGPVRGNFQILGFTSSDSIPQIPRRGNLLFTPTLLGMQQGDFIALGTANLCQGGGWDWLNTINSIPNTPNCMADFAFVMAVNADSTEPTGAGFTYGGNSNVAYSGVTIAVQPSQSGLMSAVIYYKGAASFASIMVSGSGIASYYPVDTSVNIDATNHWNILRISGPASIAGVTTITLYWNAAGTGPTQLALGSVFASSEKICPLPQYVSDVFNKTGFVSVKGAVLQGQGADVVAANNLVLGADGTYFHITGATQINLLSNAIWYGGSKVTLKFNSTPTVKNNQAVSGANKPIILNGAVDFVAAANNTLTLVYDATDAVWYEVSRKV